MKKIHILHATLFLEMGGLESIIMDIARNVDKSRFKISVLCLASYDEKYKKTIEQYGVNVFQIQRKGTFDLDFFKKIVKFLKTEKIDVLHAHSGCFFNAALCAKMAGIKSYVYTEHGLPLYDNGLRINAGLKARLEDRFAAWVTDIIFAVSDEIKQDMANRFPESMRKVRKISNGVDTELFTRSDNKLSRITFKKQHGIPEHHRIVGSVGRLVQIKNYESLLRAFSIVLENNDAVQLVLIGDGPERNNLEKLAHDLGIRQFVTFAGVQYNIFNILPFFDVFVLPSRTEGTSISLLESQSCGIPAVVTRVGGNPFIVDDGVNGYLVETNDESKIEERITELLSDDALREKMGSAAREKIIQYYSVINMVHEYEYAYLALFQKKSHDTGAVQQ